MPDRTDVIYSYDGTFQGLMCCVFESFTKREIPENIIAGEPEQLFFGELRYIETNEAHAARVERSIPEKMGRETEIFIRKAFLSCAADKDILILRFMYMGYKYGSHALYMLGNDTVLSLHKAVKNCAEEAHKLEGFIRFTDTGDALASVIEPKNTVIPLLAHHFTDRYRNDSFLIYDKTHRMALIYSNYTAEIAENIEFELPEVNSEEEYYRSLWKTFYSAIAIRERFNPRCRMNMMPKRYWSNMVEMEEELKGGGQFIDRKKAPALENKTEDE